MREIFIEKVEYNDQPKQFCVAFSTISVASWEVKGCTCTIGKMFVSPEKIEKIQFSPWRRGGVIGASHWILAKMSRIFQLFCIKKENQNLPPL